MCYLGRLVETIVIVLHHCSATEERKSLKLNQYNGPVFNRLFILMHGVSQFESFKAVRGQS